MINKQHRASGRPSRATVTLNLEALEERWLPNGATSAAAATPPSFIQAAIQLYTDGVYLGEGLVNQYVFRIAENDAYIAPLPSSTQIVLSIRRMPGHLRRCLCCSVKALEHKCSTTSK